MKHVNALMLFPALVSVASAFCPPLSPPSSGTIEVFPGQDLRKIAEAAPPGSTIILNSGTYRIADPVYLNAPGITVTSKARDRDSVIINGNTGPVSPLLPSVFATQLLVVRASGITVAHVTLCYARWHAIHVFPPASGKGIVNTRFYGLRVFDCGQQLIKVNSNGNAGNLQWADSGVLECSLLEFVDNSVMQGDGNGFYTGGFDLHGGLDWIVRHNVFRSIQRESKLLEHAVHCWNKARGTLVENNTFVDVYRAIGFGMRTRPEGKIERRYSDKAGDAPYSDHIDGIIRNNTVANRASVRLESGIELSNVKNTQVYHNSVFSAAAPFSSIESRWPNTTATIRNNIASHAIRVRNGARVTHSANIRNNGSSLFVNARSGDLHLAPGAVAAIGKAVALPAVLFGQDMDGQKPGTRPDIGADQIYGAAAAPYP